MTNFTLSTASVRTLKKALQDRFPAIKSSHLTEAIAATLGYGSHAALLEETRDMTAMPIVFLDDKPFVERLHELGYPGMQPFAFSSVLLGSAEVPQEFRDLIARLLKLEAQAEPVYPLIAHLAPAVCHDVWEVFRHWSY